MFGDPQQNVESCTDGAISWKKQIRLNYCRNQRQQSEESSASCSSSVTQAPDCELQNGNSRPKKRRSKNKAYELDRKFPNFADFFRWFSPERSLWAAGTIHETKCGTRREFYNCRQKSCQMSLRVDYDSQTEEVFLFKSTTTHQHELYTKQTRLDFELVNFLEAAVSSNEKATPVFLLRMLEKENAKSNFRFKMPVLEQIRNWLKRRRRAERYLNE
ncbi:unnamed protein product [Bursaphelenchus xylophilus]|uniref:(pine wood nematode) hypothetical protein n=1 Tax=Bursaphelenchus xylophilus TaxID=6326 RepID=A0A1I7RQD8_BURXY|nr:unnamed protein product [Bursaphelenchus xylophilus]CAG9104417.1 unnamed protein product [Bursaphelenchus xylophilus]